MRSIALGVRRPDSSKQTASSRAGNTGSLSAGTPSISKEQKHAVLVRDDYKCACCGFRSLKYQDVLQENLLDSAAPSDALVTVCIFCYQCFHLDAVSAMKSGVLIWLPEIDQPTLHHVARAIYVARISQGPIAEAARKMLDIIMGRREEIKKRIHTDDPHILANVLRDYLGAGHYKERMKKLEGVRLFPLERRIISEADLEFNQFPQILAYWRSKDGPFGGKTPPQWISIYQKLLQSA